MPKVNMDTLGGVNKSILGIHGFLLFLIFLTFEMTPRLAVSGNKYLILAVSGKIGSLNGCYKYHWLKLLLQGTVADEQEEHCDWVAFWRVQMSLNRAVPKGNRKHN